MSENTTLPHRFVGSFSIGAVNWKFCGDITPDCGPVYVHRSAFVLSTAVHVLRSVPFWMTIWSRVVEPITLSIHVANDGPFGLLVSSMRSGLPGSGLSC